MYKKLIICSTGRTGSLSLSNLLNSNKNIYCDHELYNSFGMKLGSINFKYNEKCLNRLIEDYGEDKIYQRSFTTSYLESLNKIEEEQRSKIIIGDSGMYYLNYLEDLYSKINNLKIIYLHRENLKSFVSSFNKLISAHKCNPLVAFDKNYPNTIYGNHFSASFPTLSKSVSSEKERDEVIMEYHSLFKEKFLYLERIGIPFFKIKTEELGDKDKLKEVYEFLGYSEEANLECKVSNKSSDLNFKENESRVDAFNESDENSKSIFLKKYSYKKIKRSE